MPDNAPDALERSLTEAEAWQIRTWRVDGYTWRAIAEEAIRTGMLDEHRKFYYRGMVEDGTWTEAQYARWIELAGQDWWGSQQEGMALCGKAALLLGEDPGLPPWN